MRGCTVAVALVACLLVTPAAFAAKSPAVFSDKPTADAVAPAEWGRLVSATHTRDEGSFWPIWDLVFEAPDGTVRIVTFVNGKYTFTLKIVRAPAAPPVPAP